MSGDIGEQEIRWYRWYCGYDLAGVLESWIWAGVAQLARASAFQAEGRGFESRFPLQVFSYRQTRQAHIAQAVERILGKDEVIGSSPIVGSIFFRFQKKLTKI